MNMPLCGAQTLAGTTCRSPVQGDGTKCRHHSGAECSVCLTTMGTGQSRTLECGHEFHTRCLNRWKTTCTDDTPTCPVCRQPFDAPLYRCRLIIERAGAAGTTVSTFDTSNITTISEGFGISFPRNEFTADIQFDIEQGEVLSDVLRELGLPPGLS